MLRSINIGPAQIEIEMISLCVRVSRVSLQFEQVFMSEDRDVEREEENDGGDRVEDGEQTVARSRNQLPLSALALLHYQLVLLDTPLKVHFLGRVRHRVFRAHVSRHCVR